jgi:hypothetical protein
MANEEICRVPAAFNITGGVSTNRLPWDTLCQNKGHGCKMSDIIIADSGRSYYPI